MTESGSLDFVHGDATGLRIPAHGDALRAGGAAFLTEAFRTFGSLSADNRITRIARFEECHGGSTGQKFFLTVEYQHPNPALHADLFVKFSRNFSDPIRDRVKHELESEVRFAAVSRQPNFPIKVPTAYFADYHRDTGTGVLITQRIAFGTDGIEPQHKKFLDHDLTEPLAYYQVIVKSLARLAAAHKSGRLAPDIAARFPYDPEVAAAGDPIPYDEQQLRGLVAEYADFARTYPQLLPANITSPAFIAKLGREVGRFLEHETRIKRFLQSDPDAVALCHWNAQIDNGWFWRDASGALHCGLMDWGRVTQLNVAFALWGCLGGAPLELWDRHLDELLDLFVGELHAHGGSRLHPANLKLSMQLYVATMGLAWLMAIPAQFVLCMPDAGKASGPRDPAFRDNETARSILGIFTVFLHLWQTHDFGASLDRLLGQTADRAATP